MASNRRTRSHSSHTKREKKQNYKNINDKLREIAFSKHTRKSGFRQREPKKLEGKTMLIGFFLMALQKGNNTLQSWAQEIGFLIGETVSKQAVWKRITERMTNFLLAVLFDAFLKQTKFMLCQVKKQPWLKRYRRILIQDSTVLALPAWLSWCFPGNVSKGKQKAQLKIQVVYDLLHNCFVHFEITSFTSNDQSKSKDILSLATKKDLVIRDLGYFSLECFEKMIPEHIFFISRMRFGVKIYDPKTGKEINLLREIKKKRRQI
jgi:hypothetical protein